MARKSGAVYTAICLMMICLNVMVGQGMWFNPVQTPICSTGLANQLIVDYGIWGTFNSGNVFTVQLSNAAGSFAAPTAIGSMASTGGGIINCSIPASVPAGPGYMVRIVSSSPALTSINTQPLVINAPASPPITSTTAFGNNTWNVYCYQGYILNYNACAFLGGINYFGSYTENTLSFDTRTRFNNNGSPSAANSVTGASYNGCPISSDVHIVDHRRTNFDCNIYSVSVIGHDDIAYLEVNGSPVPGVTHCGCCDAHNNVYTGQFDNSTTVSFKYLERDGLSFAEIAIVPVPPVATAATGVSTPFTSFTANWNSFYGSTNYYLDVSTSPSFTSFVPGYNNLPVGNALSYIVSGLTPGTVYYYRIRAELLCGATSINSNVVNADLLTPLPVELTEFRNICNANSVELNWSTASEHNNSHFVIQKSDNGIVFDSLSLVTGAGFSNVSNHYSYTDYTADRKVFYRLRQVDFAGNAEYSNIIYSDCETGNGVTISIDNFSLGNTVALNVEGFEKNEWVHCMITDATGRLVYIREDYAEHLKVEIPNDLSAGVYIVTVSSGTKLVSSKFIR